MKKMVRIAVDGPSGAGKSTIAKAVAAALEIDYIDTGAMYRAVAHKVISNGIDCYNEETMQKMLDFTDIDFSKGKTILDGKDISTEIRTPEVTKMASICSAMLPVRAKLVELQRKMGNCKSVIMDGRDIGTNVLTDAEYKFFLTASAEERAQRRFAEMREKGIDDSFEQVLADIKERDHNDSTRALNPLTKAKNAIEIDTTQMTIEMVVNNILSEVRKNGNC